MSALALFEEELVPVELRERLNRLLDVRWGVDCEHEDIVIDPESPKNTI